MNAELVKVYIMSINNTMNFKLRGLVLDEDEYLYLQDLIRTIKEYNKLQRAATRLTLKELEDGKDETRQNETQQNNLGSENGVEQ